MEFSLLNIEINTFNANLLEYIEFICRIGYLHFSGSSSGLTVTLDRDSETFMWQKNLNSPVVAVFVLGPEGLLSVPFTTVSDDALKNIIDDARDGQQNNVKFS